MEYETSYDTGARPFNHDKNRGNWESTKDFFYACVGHAFRPEIIMVIPLTVFETFGIYALIPYLLIMIVCVIPIVFIQSFLGQFSSTGFISVFRIAPLFKGIGYVSLVVNFINLTYYSVLSAIPLFYFFHSFNPTLPWSCVGASKSMNITELTCFKNGLVDRDNPSVTFLKREFSGSLFSVQIMMCTIIVWITATFILLKSTSIIGRFMRYSNYVIISIMGLCLLRFYFLPGAILGVINSFIPRTVKNNDVFVLMFIPLMVFSTLGHGWGSILTMASYNKFKTNIYTYSWLVCLAHLGVILGMTYLLILLKYYTFVATHYYPTPRHGEWTEFLALPFGLTLMEWPNLWCLLFTSILGLGSFNLLVVQLLSFFTSIFDEFENLREIKRNVIFGAVAVLTTTSMLFCSSHGLFFFEILLKLSVVTQIFLNFLLIMVVLWVYGRERLQRDVNFMISQIYSTKMIFIVRFVAPIFLILELIFGFCLSFLSMIFHSSAPLSGGYFLLIALLSFFMAWCLIPCYCVIKIKQTAGRIGMRLKRCVRPTDWYPADPVDKQSYEERFSSTNIAHPLTVLEEE